MEQPQSLSSEKFTVFSDEQPQPPASPKNPVCPVLLGYPVFPELEPMGPVLPEPVDLPLPLVASCQVI